MAKNNNIQDLLKSVADAIRAKKGTTALINPQDFDSEIASIAGAGIKKETIELTFPTKVISTDISYNLPNAPIFVVIRDKNFVLNEDDKIAYYVLANLGQAFSFSINGKVTTTPYMCMFGENRVSATAVSPFSQLFRQPNVTNTGFFAFVRNALFGFYGTYVCDLYYLD